MAGCTRTRLSGLAPALLALLFISMSPAPASASAWKPYAKPMTGSWKMNVLPSGVGYAAADAYFSLVDIHRTLDGGKTWKRAMMPGKAAGDKVNCNKVNCMYNDVWTLSNGNGIVTWSAFLENNGYGFYASQLTAANNKTTQHTIEIPKGLTKVSGGIGIVAAVPGQNTAFGGGSIYDGASMKSTECIWHWNGSTNWKMYKMSSSIRNVKAASPTAAWASFWSAGAGTIIRWNGKAWAELRKGAAGQEIELLTAVPPTGNSPAQVWAKLTQTAKGRANETLLLCDTTKCTAKRTAGTNGTYPGRFLTPGGFDAASAKLAFVWEALPSNNPNQTVVALQRYDGAKWTTEMKVTQKIIPQGKNFLGDTMYVYSPELRVSIGSPTFAVALLAHQLPITGKTGTLASHTWNGAKWGTVPNATFTKQSNTHFYDLDQVDQLQALRSGNALLTLFGGMWRLA